MHIGAVDALAVWQIVVIAGLQRCRVPIARLRWLAQAVSQGQADVRDHGAGLRLAA